MGLDQVPSTASLARIFREAGVARLQPRKRPRAAWRRLVYPAPNACWQLDATDYVLTGGGKCVIFQLIDDHSRYAVASHVASGETAKDAIAVFDKAVAAHGVPQRLLSDNGLALNPSRRGVVGQLVAHGAALGTEAITGKPDKPTTQGKNERFHQTCSATSTSSRSPTRSRRPRSTRSTTSTTPSVPTKGCPGAARRWPRGRRPPRPIRPAPSRTGPSTSRRSPPYLPDRSRPQTYPPTRASQR